MILFAAQSKNIASFVSILIFMEIKSGDFFKFLLFSHQLLQGRSKCFSSGVSVPLFLRKLLATLWFPGGGDGGLNPIPL